MATNTKEKVSIVGCGLVGTHWATLFASAGYTVCLYDVNADIVNAAKTAIKTKLSQLEKDGLLRGSGSAADQFMNVTASLDLADCLAGSIYCQESIKECEESKRDIFCKMDALADDNVILASSTSTIPASRFTETLNRRSQCIVAHPINPPIYVRLVEVVPSPWTSTAAASTTYELMTAIGQAPVRLQKEVLGFALNRMQYAVIAEAWRLVQAGVLCPTDVDKVMTEGLGPRYAFNGPLESMHMNAQGIKDYLQRYGEGMRKVLEDLGPVPTFNEPVARSSITQSMDCLLPVETLRSATALRECKLAHLCKLKSKFDPHLPK